jgi:Ser/Thr protein kinase RdoA (MazF antagonist)
MNQSSGDAPMGWDALGQWGEDVARVERLSGDVANDVWSVRIHGQLAVARLGTRCDADLAWETALLQHLDRNGLAVPVPMPAEAVLRCRAAWARLAGREMAVVHGDPNPRNIRMTADRVALIDWDESHVDVPDLDLDLPHNAAGLDAVAHDITVQASAAWQAAVCWKDDYAVRRLAEVRAV